MSFLDNFFKNKFNTNEDNKENNESVVENTNKIESFNNTEQYKADDLYLVELGRYLIHPEFISDVLGRSHEFSLENMAIAIKLSKEEYLIDTFTKLKKSLWGKDIFENLEVDFYKIISRDEVLPSLSLEQAKDIKELIFHAVSDNVKEFTTTAHGEKFEGKTISKEEIIKLEDQLNIEDQVKHIYVNFAGFPEDYDPESKDNYYPSMFEIVKKQNDSSNFKESLLNAMELSMREEKQENFDPDKFFNGEFEDLDLDDYFDTDFDGGKDY